MAVKNSETGSLCLIGLNLVSEGVLVPFCFHTFMPMKRNMSFAGFRLSRAVLTFVMNKAHPALGIALLVQLTVLRVVVQIVLIFQARQARIEVFSMNIIRVTFVSIILILVSAPGIALRRVRGTQPTQILQTHARLGTAVMILPALILLLASCL